MNGHIYGTVDLGNGWVAGWYDHHGEPWPLIVAAAPSRPRCSRRTQGGYPCNRRVSVPGDACPQHDDDAPVLTWDQLRRTDERTPR